MSILKTYGKGGKNSKTKSVVYKKEETPEVNRQALMPDSFKYGELLARANFDKTRDKFNPYLFQENRREGEMDINILGGGASYKMPLGKGFSINPGLSYTGVKGSIGGQEIFNEQGPSFNIGLKKRFKNGGKENPYGELDFSTQTTERDKPSILQTIDPIQKEKDIQSGKLYDAEMKEKRRAEIQAGVESGKMFEGKTYSPFERQMAKQVSEKQMRSGLEDPEVAKKIGLNLLETAMLPIEAGALNKLPEFLRYRGMKAPKHSLKEGVPWQPIQRGNYLGPEKNNRWLNPKDGLGKMERGVVDN